MNSLQIKLALFQFAWCVAFAGWIGAMISLVINPDAEAVRLVFTGVWATGASSTMIKDIKEKIHRA